MATLIELQARLEKLKRLRDTGIRSTRHGETFVENRSLEEIERIIAQLEGDISGAEGLGRRRVRYAYQSDKGL